MMKKSWLLSIALIFTTLTSTAQTEDYSAQWKNVDALDAKGLTKDALAATMKIFNDAVQKGNEPQQIKTSMYQMKYRNAVEENNIQKNILFLDTLIAKAKAPAKNILISMQAELYQAYRNSNRWRLYQQTSLTQEVSNDISTWNISALNKKIAALYKSSLSNEELLKRTNVSAYYAVILKGKNTEELRPTLYDFLANRALDYFMSTENDVTNPSYKFIINDAKAFSPANEFINHKFITQDSSALYYNALLIMQNLLRFHMNDAQPDAFADADLARLSFVNSHAVIENKEALYETALQHFETKYASNAVSAQASYLRALIHQQRGNQYNALTNKNNQFETVRAKEIAEAAYTKYPKSEGGINSYNLIQNITRPSLNFKTEKVNVPDQPFRILVNYKNSDKVYFRIVKTSHEQISSFDRYDYDNKRLNAMLAMTPVKSWSQSLPDTKDYQQHAAEVKADALPVGTYFIIASRNENFSVKENIIGTMVTYVSNISYIISNKNELYVMNRDNGKPMDKAAVQLWTANYDYSSRKNNEVKYADYVTDKNGFVKIKKPNSYNNILLNIKAGNDQLFTDDEQSAYSDFDNYSEPKTSTRKTFLFTDRSIYRPGQTVFFKGIMTATDTSRRKSSLLTNVATTFELYDDNGQLVNKIAVTSNEYGSFSGSFKIPEGLLNGNFSIREKISQSAQSFSVEEYKRPKFSAEIKKPEGSYRLNDIIKVTGSAKAYAGNNIDGAKVSYRVVRTVRYPIWYGWYYRSYYPRNTQQQEITNGETVTDQNGNFIVNFKAIPDETVEKKNDPTFDYLITADVTDLNGETRSTSLTVSVAYKAIELSITGDETITADSLKNIGIRSVNMNGLFEKVTVNVSMYKLIEPTKIFRARYWEQPDQFVMTKEEYYQNFPYDAYSNEYDKTNWPLGNKVIDKTDTTSTSSIFNLQSSSLTSGWYKIIVTGKDKFGEEIKTEKFIRIADKDLNKTKEPISYTISKRINKPGDQLNYTVSTGFDQINPVQTVVHPADNMKTEFPVVTPAGKNQSLAVTENDRGGIMINYAFVKHNRVYTGNESISVPWSNKDLTISYETFRDKILPGAEEKWKIKISGNDAEKVAAETLISMYDASLDQFQPHSWESPAELWPGLNPNISWNTITFDDIAAVNRRDLDSKYISQKDKEYASLLNNGWSNFYGGYRDRVFKSAPSGGIVAQESVMANAAPAPPLADEQQKHMKLAKPVEKDADGVIDIADKNQDHASEQAAGSNVTIRKNFNETAFFFPQLMTDAQGNVEFSFTIPEALTQWKMMVLAHTKELASGYSERTTITQKDLMVQPNAPRFLREGDKMEFSAKIVNLSDKEITGTSQLELLDAATNKPIDGWFKNVFPNQYFTVGAGQSVAVKFPIDIPLNFNSAMVYRIKAVSKDASLSDGEEAAIPVLSNRTLVTETLPIYMRNEQTKTFKFDKLLHSNDSPTLTNHALTVEYSTNPVWYAVQALPYLMEYPYECAEQSFSRWYANTLASNIANSNPRIKAVFDKWAEGSGADSAALISNLNKNEELKSVLLQEIPWVFNAKNEEQQKKNIAMLYNMVKLAAEKKKTFDKLMALQTSNGGFAWFAGGRDDRYITQYILSGIGHLKKLKAVQQDDLASLQTLISKALPYLDARIKEDYDDLIKYKRDLTKNNLSYTAVQYLYMRSFFTDTKISSSAEKAVSYYKTQAAKFWLTQNKYMQGMIALSLFRDGNEKTAKDIIESLRQNSISDAETGMYWKDMSRSGYYWYQSPIEFQALMIEAFRDISGNSSYINDLSAWLIKNKQTNQWPTTKATAEACYALLLQNGWINASPEVVIAFGNSVIKNTDEKTQAGTGYFKKTISGDQVHQGMGNITVSVGSKFQPAINSNPPSYGAVYWQYFEDLDKITSSETGLKLVKKLFIEKNSDRGPVLQPINDGDALKPGDKIKVRIELRSDRELEYVHMKDMRAACMEPVNVLSQYKWQGGLGYYESTKDASTNFFFDHLPKGTFVFEYSMFVTLAGNFSNGITTIQCMYAPEFTSHSEGVRVTVE